MKKMSKRLVALLLAAVMVMGLSITTFASTNTTHQVTIYFQEVTRAADGTAGTASPLLGSSLSNSCVTVTVNDGATYKQAINAACAQSGNDVSNAVWSGDYLQSLILDDELYKNNGSYPDSHTYVGSSWMYFNEGPANIPTNINNYPTSTLAEATIHANTTFTLSFESMTYTW